MTISIRIPSHPKDGRTWLSDRDLGVSSLDTPELHRIFKAYLEPFAELAPLHERVLVVLHGLPTAIQRDLFEDSRFRIALDDFVPNAGRTVWLACPAPGGNGSRCVVLKPRLADCPETFAHYVIAHELAHAYFRQGGWGDVTDPEDAADALAASWGFPHPAM